MLGLILAVILIYQVYKAANENGRSGVAWALIAFFGSVIFQLGVGFALGLALALTGNANMVDTLSIPISIAIGVLNLVLLWLLIKYLSRVPDTDSYAPPPPPPPTFG